MIIINCTEHPLKTILLLDLLDNFNIDNQDITLYYTEQYYNEYKDILLSKQYTKQLSTYNINIYTNTITNNTLNYILKYDITNKFNNVILFNNSNIINNCLKKEYDINKASCCLKLNRIHSEYTNSGVINYKLYKIYNTTNIPFSLSGEYIPTSVISDIVTNTPYKFFIDSVSKLNDCYSVTNPRMCNFNILNNPISCILTSKDSDEFLTTIFYKNKKIDSECYIYEHFDTDVIYLAQGYKFKWSNI